MNAEMKQVLDEVKGLLAQEREANEEKFKSLEESKTVVPEIQSKQEKLDSAIEQAQDKLESLQSTANKNAELIGNIIGGSGADVGSTAKIQEEARQFFAGVRQSKADLAVNDEEVEGYKQYKAAFPHYLRRGDAMSSEYKALMSVGSDPDGGYWVPTQTQSEIIQKLFETSPMRSISDVITITGDSVEWPNDTNDATSGGWVGEYDSRNETDTPQVGMTKIYVREQYAMPKVTQRLLDMASIDVEAWLSNKISDKLSRVENTAFVSGGGVDRPRGFLDYKDTAVTTDDDTRAWGVLQQVVSGASGGFPKVSGSSADDPDALITLISKLNPQYRAGARWVMNRSSEATVRKLKDADGRYFVDFGELATGTFGFRLFGFPITTAEDMPDIAANSYSLAFGNFGVGYQIVDGRGIRVLRDNLTTKGQVKFYTTKFTGGDVIHSDAIKLLKMSA